MVSDDGGAAQIIFGSAWFDADRRESNQHPARILVSSPQQKTVPFRTSGDSPSTNEALAFPAGWNRP